MHLGERIRQAREIRGWTQEQLAAELGKHTSLVGQIEGGFRLPSDEILESVALATKLPLAFFNEPPHQEFPISEVLFRGPRAMKRRDVLDAVRYAEHVFSVYSTVSRKVREVPCLLQESRSEPASAARSLKESLGIDWSAPMQSLIRPLERAGIVFLALPRLNSGEAFSVWINHVDGRQSPVIAYAVDKECVDRARLSIAHELGHLVMHKSFLRKVHSEIEDEAFSFGAEWLMPEQSMRRDIREPVTLTSLAKLKPIWGVSVAALVKRAFDLNLISKRQYSYLFEQLSKLGWKGREPEALDVPVEKPRLFRKIVQMAYGNPIDFEAFAGEVKVSAQELRRIMANYEDNAKADPVLRTNLIQFSKV